MHADGGIGSVQARLRQIPFAASGALDVNASGCGADFPPVLVVWYSIDGSVICFYREHFLQLFSEAGFGWRRGFSAAFNRYRVARISCSGSPNKQREGEDRRTEELRFFSLFLFCVP